MCQDLVLEHTCQYILVCCVMLIMCYRNSAVLESTNRFKVMQIKGRKPRVGQAIKFYRNTSQHYLFLSFHTASAISSPPTTPTQLTKPSPPFPLEENRSLPMHQEERLRSLSSPPDTGQYFSMPSAKPPHTAFSAPIATSRMVSAP